MASLTELTCEMIRFDEGEPELIQHFLKVHAFAELIGEAEGLPAETLKTLLATALVHDIGIKICMQQLGKCNGKLQEQYGPPAAEAMLRRLGFDEALVQRASYLVAHHHTYTDIDGADYRILVEADFLVNLYENSCNGQTIAETYARMFQTATGRRLCRQMFGLPPQEEQPLPQ